MNSTIEQLQPVTTDAAPSNEWTDEELLLAYRNRQDRRAFELLVHRYQRELYSYLRHYLGDAEMAEDAFQGTFLQVHLKCERFEPGRKVRPWLYTVATNQAIDAQRRNRRHRLISLDRRSTVGGDGEEGGSLAELLESHEINPFDQVDAAEQQQLVRAAVDELPDALREVLLLVYYQGLKYREAAEILAIPVGTVKSRLHVAINKLNQILFQNVDLLGHG